MNGDWRDFRPAIWTAMIGVAVMLVITPAYLSGILFGAAIGLAIRIRQRRRAASAAPSTAKRRRRRR